MSRNFPSVFFRTEHYEQRRRFVSFPFSNCTILSVICTDLSNVPRLQLSYIYIYMYIYIYKIYTYIYIYKILSTPSFEEKVKPSVPCRRFVACKRSLELRGSRILDEICRNISRPRRVPPSATRGILCRWT